MSEIKEESGVLIIGLGNDYRSDDGIGLYVSRCIEQNVIRGVSVINGISDGTSLLDYWDGKDHVILIDAVSPNQSPGYLYKFDGLSENISEDLFTAFSTHSLNIQETIKLGKALGKLPQKLTIYGIEGEKFKPGNKLSKTVETSAKKLIMEIIETLKVNKDA
ncbi:MAG: hydrogenase maturation protease [Candidatus Zixiibacteriota bacterium]